MDDFFTPVSTTYTNPRLQGASSGGTLTSVVKNNRGGNATNLTTPEEALEILKSKPDYSDFIHVLKYLSHPSRQFSLFTPGPRSSSITTVLVDEIAPNYWPIFQESLKEKSDHLQAGSDADPEIFLACLRSPGGTNGILRRLQGLIIEVKSVSGGLKRPDLELHIDIYLDLLSALLGPDDALESLYIRSTSSPNTDPASHASKDIVSLLGRGVIVSTAAEADFLIGRRGSSLHWVSDAKRYVEWLARSMSCWMKKSPPEKSVEFCAEVLVHSWSIGYSDDMHRELFTSLLLQEDAQPQALSTLLLRISPTQRDKASHGLLSFVSRLVQDVIEATEPSLHNSVVSAAATMIKTVLPSDVLSKGAYIAWLVPEPSDSISESNVWIRRAIIACFSDDVEFLADLLNKALALFGDPLWIGWAPLVVQQTVAEVVLISSAYLSPPKRSQLRMIAGGPLYTAMVSARLETPNNAARALGMVVGEAISALIHNSEQRLNFDMSETDSADNRRLKNLTKVNDKLGPVKPLLASKKLPKTNPSPVYTKEKPKKPKPTVPPPQKSKLIIEEVGSSDDDITPYDKPDSDDEDSEEDPTLVRRDNVKAPVYIRNLILYLRDIDNYDKQKIGLKTAPSLIRRKANFGDEVRDHAEELATLFVGLQDKYDLEDFYELRLESMVSLVVALPKSMGPWFIKSFFQGDFSLSQRGVILAALGIATRELGGFQQSAYAAGASFPSKKLTEKMDRLFLGPSSSDQASVSGSNLKALPPTALDGIAKSMATSFLGPLAAEAADKATGPDALKLSTLKSKVKRATNNKTGTLNVSSKVIAAYILRPLVERYQYAISVKGSRMARILAEPYLLTTYLKTVAVAYHAGGPAMPDLLDLTNLAWDAVLAIRSYMAGNLPATAAGLTILAVILDVNEDSTQRLVSQLGPQITDTIEWLNQLLTIVRGGEQEEDDVRLLASGVMVRLHQIVEKYRMNLMGVVY